MGARNPDLTDRKRVVGTEDEVASVEVGGSRLSAAA